ncbi:hypothetical protein PAECIP111893_02477 [Paenibacillus plantiphilus]|uniref:Uncharacterized protein n=1 Tax=Paenibacillus plantiphilus TaxID=2905650 RepID=A0ABN8GDB9_9BACL|nr:hypothetical protein [Paenibacillus plantiphilus]CAH1206231.1 hypothetical protein PAECIP111893_02477 [Paenibacillus plantiphilus]
MFVRFHGNYCSSFTKQPAGIFAVIYHLKRDGKLSDADSELYGNTLDWFEDNLPNPPLYDEQNNSIRAVTWFKDGERTEHMIERLKPFFEIAATYGVQIIKSVAEEPPGTIVYEDDYQIAVAAYPAAVNMKEAGFQ